MCLFFVQKKPDSVWTNVFFLQDFENVNVPERNGHCPFRETVTARFVKWALPVSRNGHWHKIAEFTFLGVSCYGTGFSVPTSNNPSKNLKIPTVGLFITYFSACLRRISYEHFSPLLGKSF